MACFMLCYSVMVNTDLFKGISTNLWFIDYTWQTVKWFFLITTFNTSYELNQNHWQIISKLSFSDITLFRCVVDYNSKHHQLQREKDSRVCCRIPENQLSNNFHLFLPVPPILRYEGGAPSCFFMDIFLVHCPSFICRQIVGQKKIKSF